MRFQLHAARQVETLFSHISSGSSPHRVEVRMQMPREDPCSRGEIYLPLSLSRLVILSSYIRFSLQVF